MTTPDARPRPRPRPRLLVVVCALVAVLAAALVGLVSPASAATPSCGITWGSLPQNGAAVHSGGTLTNVRAGEQACFDRLVVDIAGTTAFDAWHVQYVTHVYSDAKGDLVPLRGGAFLQITAAVARPHPGRRPHLPAGEPQRAGERLGLPHVPPGGVGRRVRGLQQHRPRRPRPAAIPGLRAQRHPRQPQRHAGRDRRRAQLVSSSG